jgi:glycosyltransferase involved in cell wall biosynthesis
MIAYACSPAKGGEHLLGWEWAVRLARHHHVTVLTCAGRLSESEGRRPPQLRLFGVDDRRFLFLRRFGVVGTFLYYWVWQIAAARLGQELIRREGFDVVHQTTFHTCRIPGRLAAAGNPPFVWGPVAGLEQVPLRMWPVLGLGAGRELLRAVSGWVVLRLPSITRTLREAQAVLVSNGETLDRLQAICPRTYVRMAANAVELPPLPPYEPAGSVLDLVAVGALVRMRPHDLVLRALACLDPEKRRQVRLTFLGDGPDRRRLERRARQLGLGSCVQFGGQTPRAETLARMRRAHLLVFPSLRDSGSSAVAEALAMGLPVLALRLAGPGSMLAGGGGILVRAQSPRQVVEDIATLLRRLINDRLTLEAESARARSRAESSLGWNSRLQTIEEIYGAVCRASEARVG